MPTVWRVLGAVALVALVFAPGRVLDTDDAAALEAATLAPTFTSAELTRSQPPTPAPVAVQSGRAPDPAVTAAAATLLAVALAALLVDAAARPVRPVAHGTQPRRRGPPLLAL